MERNQMQFDYTTKNGKEITLTATDEHIDQAAADLFKEWALSSSVSEAIECACGSFWKEGELNAVDCLINNGAVFFWKYLKENTGFFNSKEVTEKAAALAVKEFENE